MSAGDDLLDILRPLGWIPANVYVAWQIVKWIYRRYAERRARRAPPKEIIEHRVRIRDEIVKRLRLPRREDAAPIAPPEYGAIFVRDVRHHDEFPEEEQIGRAPWVWTRVYGLYHHGIEVVLTDVKKAVQVEWEADTGRDRWRFLNDGESPDLESAIDAVPYGRIPFDYIERIDWGEIEDSKMPIFFCRYDSPFGDPYAAIIYRAELWETDPRVYVELRGLRPDRDEWGVVHRLAFRLHQSARRRLRRVRKAITK